MKDPWSTRNEKEEEEEFNNEGKKPFGSVENESDYPTKSNPFW